VAPESSTLLGNCSDTTSHLITRSHVESGQNPRTKRAVLHRAALYGLWAFLTDRKSSAPSSYPQPSGGDIMARVSVGKGLPPGVQRRQEADLRPEMFRIGGDDAQRLRSLSLKPTDRSL
jgi:hypothetical protein